MNVDSLNKLWCNLILLNNADNVFIARQCHFSFSVIIKRITWFLRFELCFEMYACLISSLLCGTFKILIAIVLLFPSNVFQSFLCDGKLISFQLHWSTKVFFFVILFGFYAMFDELVIPLQHVESFCCHFCRFIVAFCF